MPYLAADTYYEMLGLTPIPPEELARIVQVHADDPIIQRFSDADARFRAVGDDASNREFYACFYRDVVPELNVPWCEAYTRAYSRSLDREVLPELARFCDAPEPRASVLDLGCGDGLALCYLAREFPAARFVGVDRCRAALDRARRRMERLDLTNVTLVEDDAFALEPLRLVARAGERFDAAIVRNALDDVRESGTPYLAAKFSTVRRFASLRPMLTPNARVWVSLTPYPRATPEFAERVRADLEAAGYTAVPPLEIPYTVAGHPCVHLWWTVCPRLEPETTASDLCPRPEYVAAYHYPKGAAIPVEDVVLAERCYINLHAARQCPRCSKEGGHIIYTGGPARTLVNYYKVSVRVYACGNPRCEHGYAVAEVID